LESGSSLFRLLAQRRGARLRRHLPALTEAEILAWADAHYQRTGQWPQARFGAIADAPGTRWASVDQCLRIGSRGLPGGSTLARLLFAQRGVRNKKCPLSIAQILAWADAYHRRTGRWPRRSSGPVEGAPPETWDNLNRALAYGWRGLQSGSNLPQLLAQRRGV